MNPQEADALAQFCADQYFSFDARAWRRRSLYDHQASAVAAMYLSMTHWYGHEDELERIAAESQALHVTGESFQRGAQANQLDSAEFATKVRAEIARRRLTGAAPVLPIRSASPRATF